MKKEKKHIKGRFGISVPPELCAFAQANNLQFIREVITCRVSRFKDNTACFSPLPTNYAYVKGVLPFFSKQVIQCMF